MKARRNWQDSTLQSQPSRLGTRARIRDSLRVERELRLAAFFIVPIVVVVVLAFLVDLGHRLMFWLGL